MMGNDRLLLQPTMSLISPRMTSVTTSPRGESSVKGSPRGEFQKRFSTSTATSTVTDSTLLNAMNQLEGAAGECGGSRGSRGDHRAAVGKERRRAGLRDGSHHGYGRLPPSL